MNPTWVHTGLNDAAGMQTRSQTLQAGVHSMQRERVALEQSTNELNGRAKALERWLAANESKMPSGQPV